MYKARFTLQQRLLPSKLGEWLADGLPKDITTRRGSEMGQRVIAVEIEAVTLSDLEAKRKAFNALLVTNGYGIK